ncbi:MAG: ABC transporter permease [Candidatus Asgardarchaeia archaeon]
MLLFKIIKYKFLLAVRGKEFYIYIIGIPLIFMIIYGAMASSAYSSIEPIKIGFINNDVPLSYSLGNDTFNVHFGDDFYKYIKNVTYENSTVKMFEIINVSSREDAEKMAARLEIAGAIYIPENFSESLLNFSKAMTYHILMSMLAAKANEAYGEGNYDLGTRYSQAMDDISSLANVSYRLRVHFIGDPTSSDAMTSYEYLWKSLVNFAYMQVDLILNEYANYLSDTYNITINLNSTEFSTDVASTFSVEFDVIGGKAGTAKETFMQLYFSVLVPGQLTQSIMFGSTVAIYMIGHDIERNLLARLKLTKLRSSEYIGGILIAWGFTALFQSGILLAVAFAFGYLRTIGTAAHIAVAVIALALGGVITAAFSMIIVSFVSERVSAPLVMVALIPVSMFIAGYFPVPNPTIGEFMGETITALDLLPWRAVIIAVRKSLMLPNVYSVAELVPDVIILILWTTLYSVISFVTFSEARLKKRE